MDTALLPQLQVFFAVARLRSFSAAARELGVTRSAVSQAVRQLETKLQVVLLTRTTRSVALTELGRKLLETGAPALTQAVEAAKNLASRPGEITGKLKLTMGRAAVPYVLDPVLPVFRSRYPRVELEIDIDERLVDLVGEGYDAGVRLSESIERDMVQLRLTGAFRFVVVGSPKYLARHGTPSRPEDLLQHECLTFRSRTTGSLYAWELERGRRNWRVPVRGSIVANEASTRLRLAARGMGLTYTMEPEASELLRRGELKLVLEDYAASVTGFFLYFPSRAQRTPALKAFVDTAREVAPKTR